jgi:hypothetical protein
MYDQRNVIGCSVLFTGSGFQLIEGTFKFSLLIVHHGFISLLISVPPEHDLVPCYVILHHDSANAGPYIFHIISLYVHYMVWVESCTVTWRVNLCSMPLSDIHFDLSIFSLVSVWETFVMHDTGPGRQSFSQIDCQIYIENYMVTISGAAGTCSFSTLRWHYIFAGRVLSFCTLPIVHYSKKRTCHFGFRIYFSP